MIHVVAVHGNGGGGMRFDRLPRPLAADVVLHAPTLPGFGGRPLGGVSGIEDLADALRTELPVTDDPVVLVGHGIGGSVVLQLLADHPTAADAVVLHAPVGTRLDTRWFPRLLRPRWVREAVRRTIASPLLRPVWRRTIVRDVPEPWAARFLDGYRDAEAFGAMFDWLTSAWFERLPPRTLPAVLLWGEDDRVLGADQRADYHRLLPRASERTVPGWGHFPMLTDPTGYARELVSLARDLVARATEPAPAVTGTALLGSCAAQHAPPKAALLDRAAAAGLPVPRGLVLHEAALTATSDELASHVAATLPDLRVAVRSAFAGEDGPTTSGAGRFHTELDVDTGDVPAVAAALDAVLSSADEGVARAVVVQRQVAAEHAGVAFLEPDFEDDLVDVVTGLADDLVAGRVPGERVSLPRVLPGEPGSDGWRGRLQVLLRGLRDEFGDDPWDVEWADDGMTCWLVQVRPITAPPRRDEVLTLANHREILPDPPSRLMTSLIVDAAPDAYGYWQRFAPDLPANRPFAEEYAGRPLLNLSLLADTMRRLGLPTSLVTDSMGGSRAEALVPPVGLRPRRLLRHARALLGLGIDQLRAPLTAERTITALQQRTRDLDGGFTETLAAARDVYVELLHAMFALSTAVAGPLAVLQALGVSAEHHARHRSAGTAVWDDLGPLRTLVTGDPVRRAAVERGEVPADPVFQRAWSAFLERHGHRGIHESDLAQPRYHEDPSPLLATLLVEERTTDPPPRTLLGRLTTPLWWQASRAIRAREELRSGAMRAFDRLRQRLLELAAAAVDAERLPELDAVWACTVDELRRLDQGGAIEAGHLRDVHERRAALAALRLPDAVRRSDDPWQWAQDASPVDDRLTGLPLTTGDVRGTVWRLDAPAHEPPPVDGPVVVVAPAVDAGWISTFARADAVVVETGGELSHGSIVLRERGVPAVTNVAGATGLATGQQVVVRAASGVVELVG